MLTIAIHWHSPDSTLRSVYSCDHYLVSEELFEDGEHRLALHLDDSKHHIILGGLAIAYVMNSQGKTIDTIKIWQNWDANTQQKSA